jgi:GT2 family glycosyltransferase
MKVSVLICTYKRERLLEQCLYALIKCSSELPDEIIIVDGDEGKTANIITTWQKKFSNIKLIPTKNINPSISRNIGLVHCAGDIIALTDDDVEVTGDWIKKIKQLHEEHPEAGAIGGRIISVGDNLLGKVADSVIFPFPDKAGYIRTVATANASYKKEAIEKVGRFDETLFRGEDVDYNWRVLQKGYKIYYDPQLIVKHHHRASWRGLLRQVFMYGKAYYLVRCKWKDMYCVYPHRLAVLKDFLKLGYFFIGIFMEPAFQLKKIKGIFGKAIIYPLLVIMQVSWRYGIIRGYRWRGEIYD